MTEKLITTRYIIEISICQILKERKKAFGFKSSVQISEDLQNENSSNLGLSFKVYHPKNNFKTYNLKTLEITYLWRFAI